MSGATWSPFFGAPSVQSRSINAENPTGAAGSGARASSNLGPGRKGSPAVDLAAGETITLAEIQGPGVIRHLWITVPDRTDAGPFVLRDLVLRAYWEGEDTPSIEVPLGDFFCNGFAERALVTSEPIVVAPTGGMNSFFAMPFTTRARITLENEHPGPVRGVFYQVDYSIGDELPADVAHFHAQWRRSNGTTQKGQDHVIVDGIRGTGHYVGTYIGLAALERFWWGEGEVKFFIDGEEDPTQCSTGLEDYAGGAWAFQDALRTEPAPVPIPFSAPYFGYTHATARDSTHASPFWPAMPPTHGMFRWHLPDPVTFRSSLRVTVQQIGAWDHGLFERCDDVCSTAYWYQVGSHAPFPVLPTRAERQPR